MWIICLEMLSFCERCYHHRQFGISSLLVIADPRTSLYKTIWSEAQIKGSGQLWVCCLHRLKMQTAREVSLTSSQLLDITQILFYWTFNFSGIAPVVCFSVCASSPTFLSVSTLPVRLLLTCLWTPVCCLLCLLSVYVLCLLGVILSTPPPLDESWGTGDQLEQT